MRSLSGLVQISCFAAFNLTDDGQWRLANWNGREFTRWEFEQWYSAPGAILRPGRTYFDPQNWGGRHNLRNKLFVKWLYVGITQSGDYVQGSCIIQELPVLIK